MIDPDSMAKTIANMTYLERVDAITRELHSPAGVKRADETLEALIIEYAAILGIREAAAARFGIPTPAPNLSAIHAKPADKAAETPTKDDAGGVIARMLDLMNLYRTDEDSPLKKVRFATQRYYETNLKRLLKDCGDRRLDQINAQIIQEWHKTWAVERGVSMARALITMLRMLFSYGLTRHEDKECERLSLIMSKLEFEIPKSRNETLSEDLADAIRVEAHNQNRGSIALAQGFQFNTALTQKEVIGEWVPINDPEQSRVINGSGDKKWVRGLRWEEIDADLILRHPASNGKGLIVLELKKNRMVMEELQRLGSHPATGPIIMNEHTSLPWLGDDFRWYWRKIATAVGVPKTVRYADSRAKEDHTSPRYRDPTRGKPYGGTKKKRAAKDDPSATRVH